MNKKFLYVLLTSLAVFGVTACGSTGVSATEEDPAITPAAEQLQDSEGRDLTADGQEPDDTEEKESICSSGNAEINELAEQTIVLEEGEQIEAQEWVDPTCFRVKISYRDLAGSVAVHCRDYFFFCEDDPLSVMVDYAAQSGSGVERPVYPGCDFEARREDVNFDGHPDLLIALGNKTGGADQCWCAYLYEDGGYRYEPSFEEIVNYRLNTSGKVIYSNYLRNGTGIEDFYSYNDPVGEFEKTGSCTVANEFFYQLIAQLIVYENENNASTQGVMNYAIVSEFGEHINGDSRTLADGSKVYPNRKMPVADLEIFYREVLGVDKTFPVGYEDSTGEAGIVVPRNEYAYAYNGIGEGTYPMVESVVQSAGVTEVICNVINEFDDSRVGTVSFSLTSADNPYEYTLITDSVEYIEN